MTDYGEKSKNKSRILEIQVPNGDRRRWYEQLYQEVASFCLILPLKVSLKILF